MPEYRRNRVPGGTFFFTVNLLDRRSDLLVRHIGALREAVRQARQRGPFVIDAWVVLPDHMHCLWTLPAGDADLPADWMAGNGEPQETDEWRSTRAGRPRRSVRRNALRFSGPTPPPVRREKCGPAVTVRRRLMGKDKAKAGVQGRRSDLGPWIPAFAGMTGCVWAPIGIFGQALRCSAPAF
jgi:hypothetical protein